MNYTELRDRALADMATCDKLYPDFSWRFTRTGEEILERAGYMTKAYADANGCDYIGDPKEGWDLVEIIPEPKVHTFATTSEINTLCDSVQKKPKQQSILTKMKETIMSIFTKKITLKEHKELETHMQSQIDYWKEIRDSYCKERDDLRKERDDLRKELRETIEIHEKAKAAEEKAAAKAKEELRLDELDRTHSIVVTRGNKKDTFKAVSWADIYIDGGAVVMLDARGNTVASVDKYNTIELKVSK